MTETLAQEPLYLFRSPLAFLASTALATSLCMLQTAPAYAQDEGVLELAPIIISGTKRNETLEDYTGSVTVVSTQQLQDRGIKGGEDAVNATPGANYYSYGDRQNAFTSIRGVGPILQPLSPDDSSVLTFVDGAPLMLEQSSSSYLDLEQVEVFKGPQNTTFGRNTSGGAINLVPAKPTNELEGSVRFEFGTDDEYLFEVIGNTPIVADQLSARFALRRTGRDGYITNTTGPDFGDEQLTVGRASLLYTPSDVTSVLFTYAAENTDLTPTYYIGQIGDGDLLEAAQNYASDESRSHMFSLKVEHDFDRFRFTSQTAYNQLDAEARYQGDHNLWTATFGLPPSVFAVDETNRLFWKKDLSRLTQEFRLSSLPGDRISWVSGLVAYRDEHEISNDNHVFIYQGYNSGKSTMDQTNKGVAIYGDATIPLNERLSLAGGLRFGRETKEFTSVYDANGVDALYPGVVPTFEEDGKETYEYWTGKLAVSYDWSHTLNTYASISRGYKSGGFGYFNSLSAYGVAREAYKPSETLSYEIGARTTLLGGALKLSGTLFHIDMNDEQILLFDANSSLSASTNLDAESSGLEITADWQIDDSWQFDAALAYIDTKITSVPAAAAALNPGLEVGDQLPVTPEWAINLGLGYRSSAADFGWVSANAPAEISARIDYSYTGERFFDGANNGKLGETHLVSGRIGFHWDQSEVYLFGKNLLDEDYLLTRQPLGTAVGTTTPAYGVTPGRGRTIGVGYAMKF